MAQGRVPGLSGVSSLRTAHAHRPDQLALLGGLLALAVVAWLVTGDRMGGMESIPGMALGGLGARRHTPDHTPRTDHGDVQ